MTDVQTRLHIDRSANTFTFVSTQDVEPILDRNKALRSIEEASDWRRHVASIPNIIIQRWLHEELDRGNVTLRLFTDEFDRLIERKLKDPEWAYLRTDAPKMRVAYIGNRGLS